MWPALEQQSLTSFTQGCSTMAMVKQVRNLRDSGRLQGGLLPDGEGQPAFELFRSRPSAIPILIAVPHAGRIYPAGLLGQMRFPDQARLRLEDRLADVLAHKVAEQTGAALLVSHAPRAMIDLNRSPDDMDWDMVAGGSPKRTPRMAAGRRARSGLGLVPRRLSGMGEIWNRQLPLDELNARIELVHKPYHLALSQGLENLRDRWGSALLIDLHSMPPLGPKFGHSPSPDFVVGDRYGSSCGANISLAAISHFEGEGRNVAHNRPYAGGYVLDRHSAPARGIHALQLEVCRAAYLDAELIEPGEELDNVAQLLANCVRKLADEISSGSRSLPQAAE
jgi:N-formylglutamate amidohydrolase